MRDVANLHLQKRGTIWHYYRRVPPHFVASMGKAFIKKSLKPSDKAAARKLRSVRDVHTDMIFAAKEVRLAKGEQSVPVSLEMLTEHVRANLVKQGKGVAAAQALEPPVDWEDRKERMDNADEEISILRNQWDPRCDEWVSWATDRILKQVGVTPTDDASAGHAVGVRFHLCRNLEGVRPCRFRHRRLASAPVLQSLLTQVLPH